MSSVSVVPVGLTRYRDGLYPLTQYDGAGSLEVIRQVSKWQERLLKKHGSRLIFLSDEFYLNAGVSVPDAEEYEGFPQLENGVGLIASMKEEFESAVKLIEKKKRSRTVTIATGELAAGFISELAKEIEAAAEGVSISVKPIKNNFFGGGVNVAGLVCGCDIIEQLRNTPTTDALIIPHSMLRDDDEIFLDDTTVEDVERALGMKVSAALNDGYDFIEKILGEELF